MSGPELELGLQRALGDPASVAVVEGLVLRALRQVRVDQGRAVRTAVGVAAGPVPRDALAVAVLDLDPVPALVRIPSRGRYPRDADTLDVGLVPVAPELSRRYVTDQVVGVDLAWMRVLDLAPDRRRLPALTRRVGARSPCAVAFVGSAEPCDAAAAVPSATTDTLTSNPAITAVLRRGFSAPLDKDESFPSPRVRNSMRTSPRRLSKINAPETLGSRDQRSVDDPSTRVFANARHEAEEPCRDCAAAGLGCGAARPSGRSQPKPEADRGDRSRCRERCTPVCRIGWRQRASSGAR